MNGLDIKKVFVHEATATLSGKQSSKRLVPDPPNDELVRQSYALFANTRSLVQVRGFLIAHSTQRWNTDKVKHLLRNEVYLGILIHGEWRNETAFEPIVDRELWQLVNDMLDEKKRVYPA